MTRIELYISFLVITFLTSIPCLSQDESGYQETKCAKRGVLTSVSENEFILIQPILKDYISSWSLEETESKTAVLLTHSDPEMIRTTENEFTQLEEFQSVESMHRNSKEEAVLQTVKNGMSSIYLWKDSMEFVELLEGTKNVSYLHPFITESGDQIYFSCNLKSEKNFDIYLINRLPDDAWSAPVQLAAGVNTGAQEFYPTMYEDSLYFSRVEDRQLDLYSSSRANQFSSSRKLGVPFNSTSDDFLLHKLAESYYLTSNRDAGEDRPFLLREKPKVIQEKLLLTGYLACSGNRISNIPITLATRAGRKIDNDITDLEGKFILKSDKQIKKYKLKLDENDSRIKDCAILYLTDPDGNVVQKIKIGKNNEFIFEIIDPDEIENLGFKSVEDESLLQIEIDGQVFEDEPGDVGKGEPVRIISDEGEMIALAYTSAEGKFKFSDLSPDSKYTFKFDEESKQLKLNIFKNDTVIEVDVKENQAIYERLDPENSIELIDETGKNITIAKDEFFNLSNIFYENNSSQLSEIAKFQLDRLSKFIFNNDEITVELTSHTDSRGEAAYNLELSNKRSKRAYDYLVSKGVKSDQLIASGKGEQELLNECKDGVNCTEEQHAVNRRTEIKITVN